MTKRFQLDSVARFLLRLPRRMGENPFIGFLLLLCLALFISSLVFYRYVFTARGEDVGSEVIEIRLDQQKFQQVIKAWQEREMKFNQAESGPVRDIFLRQQEEVEIID